MTQYAGHLLPQPEPKIDLTERRSLADVTFRRISPERLVEIAGPQTNQALKINSPVVLELSSRHPYDETLGRIDVYAPGRWDTEINLIFMMPIVTGPSPGMWEGSVLYGKFNSPAQGNYLLAGNFSGYDTTMKLNGPWGSSTAYTAQTSDAGAVTALWTGSGPLFFTMSCTGSGLGYIESIQVFQLP